MEWKSLIICLEGLPISALLPAPINIDVNYNGLLKMRREKRPGKHAFKIIFIILLLGAREGNELLGPLDCNKDPLRWSNRKWVYG